YRQGVVRDGAATHARRRVVRRRLVGTDCTCRATRGASRGRSVGVHRRDSPRHGRTVSVEAVLRRMDAREPAPRRGPDNARERTRGQAAVGTSDGERRARDDGSSGTATDDAPRRVAAAGDGRRELRGLGERLVALGEEPREHEGAGHDRERGDGRALSGRRRGAAGGRGREAAVEVESGGARAIERRYPRNRYAK